jgi:hypothetical protein
VVAAAIRSCPYAVVYSGFWEFPHLPRALDDDRELVLTTIRNLRNLHGAVRYASEFSFGKGPKDRIVREMAALEAVRKDGLALEHTTYRTGRVVLEAVRNNGLALRYAYPEEPMLSIEEYESQCRDDYHPRDYGCHPDEYDLDRYDPCKEAKYMAECKLWELWDADEKFPDVWRRRDDDVDIDENTVIGVANPMQWETEREQEMRDVTLAAVRNNGLALEYASSRLRRDKEVVLAAVRQNVRALRYAARWLQDDCEVRRVAQGGRGW